LTVHEALNGVPGVRGAESLRLSASAGFGWHGKKGDNVVGAKPDARLTEDVSVAVKDILDMIDAGIYSAPVWTCNLKDEPRKPGKLPRLFMACGMEHTVVARIYLIPLVALVMAQPFRFRIGLGLNPWSSDWTTISDALCRYQYHFAGDYKGFDKRQQMAACHAVAELCRRLSALIGYSTKDQLVVKTIVVSLCSSIVCANGDVIGLYGSNPSGNSFTTLLNSFINILIYVVVSKAKSHDWRSDFLLTYGDDLVAAHNDSSFTQLAMVDVALRCCQQIYTDAVLKSTVTEFTALKDVTFLGRSFGAKHGDLTLCPLRWESITKMLHFEAEDVDPVDSVRARFGEVVVEMSQHENYDSVVNSVAQACRVLGLNPIVPTREEVLQAIREGTFGKWLSPIVL
jgi:hypothetical protein